MTQFCVITKTPPNDEGNLAAVLDLYRQISDPADENYGKVVALTDPWFTVELRTPVFHVGELLMLDGDGREVTYPGRKPRKWKVEYETFDDLTAAVTRAKEVFEQSLRSQAAAD